MALATCKTKYVRVSPRKARLVLNLVRGKPVLQAMTQLSYTKDKAGRLLRKTLESAVANAENNADANREDLYVKEVRVDAGPYSKRVWARSKGRRSMIKRKTSHFVVALDKMQDQRKGK